MFTKATSIDQLLTVYDIYPNYEVADKQNRETHAPGSHKAGSGEGRFTQT
jgi:hypothetical protein